jgi:hypothetical protein
MLKDWHKQDIFDALQKRNWLGPFSLPVDSYEVGEAYKFTHNSEVLSLYFLADLGTGFIGKESIESVIARLNRSEQEYDLWLHGRRDTKWKRDIHDWAEEIVEADDA